MKKQSCGTIKAERIYPLPGSKRVDSIEHLKTVGIALTKEEAKELVESLEKAISDPNCYLIDITGYRERKVITILTRYKN